MNPSVRCRLLRSAAEIDQVASDWERLWRALRVRHVFQGFGWNRAILDAHGAEREACVAVAEDGGRVVGVLPLALARGRLSFLGSPYADYNDLVCEESRAAEVLGAMLGSLAAAGHAEALLENVREDALLRQAAAQVDAALQGRLRWSAGVTCPTTLLEPDAEAVVAGILKKQSLRRHRKRLESLGRLEFRHVLDLGEARALLPPFFAQHQARRAAAGDVSRFDDPAARRFYEALLHRLGLESVRFGVLELDGVPVAFHFGFECDRRLVWYKASFDVKLENSGPGEVLLGKLFEYARDRRLVELDFTRGAEAFKARFANASRQNYSLRVLPAGVAGAVRRLELFAKAGVKRITRRGRA